MERREIQVNKENINIKIILMDSILGEMTVDFQGNIKTQKGSLENANIENYVDKLLRDSSKLLEGQELNRITV